MDTNVLNYNVIVKKEPYKKGFCFTTFVPTLGIADYGKTIDEALEYTKEAIKLQIETLMDLKQPVPPPDIEEAFMTVTKVQFEKPIGSFSFAW